MSTHPPGGTPPPQTPTPTPKRLISPVFGKILGKVEIWEVAKIAAMLLREGASLSSDEAVKGGDEKDPLVAATAKAFALLEIASYGQRGWIEADSYAAGLAEFVESRTMRGQLLKSIASGPKWEWKYNEQGQPLPVPFNEGLAELIPMPGVSASKATDTRMVRFKKYLAKLYRHFGPEQDEQKRMIEVGERIEQMKREGIPARVFSTACFLYSDWWDAHQREQNSAKGKKGQEVKQAKQAASEPKQGRKKKK